MHTLNAAQSNAINNAAHTHNYSALLTQDSDVERLQEQFELCLVGSTVYDVADDIGGLVVYYNEGAMVAYYDYENAWGAVFADPIV